MKYLALLPSLICFISFSAFADTDIQTKIDQLEKNLNGKIGIYAVDTTNNHVIAHRADERFPFQSTMKLMAVGALFKQSDKNPHLLQEKVYYTKKDLIWWHPVTSQHVASGMTFEALAEAAMTYSDNVAANLIIKKLGGPKAITTFAHSIDNTSLMPKAEMTLSLLQQARCSMNLPNRILALKL